MTRKGEKLVSFDEGDAEEKKEREYLRERRTVRRRFWPHSKRGFQRVLKLVQYERLGPSEQVSFEDC
jgi:hypothetical protein